MRTKQKKERTITQVAIRWESYKRLEEIAKRQGSTLKEALSRIVDRTPLPPEFEEPERFDGMS